MRAAIQAGCSALLLAAPVAAQSRFILDLSGGTTRHQFADAAGAVSVAPRFLLRTPNARLDLGLTYTGGAATRWNAEGGVDAALRHRLGASLSAELGATGWWTAHRIGEGTGQMALLPVLKLDTRIAEFSVDGGIGHAATGAGGRWFGVLGAGGRWFLGPIDVQGGVRRTQFGTRTLRYGSEWIIPGDRPDTLPPPDTVSTISSFSDVGVTAGWMIERNRLSIGIEQRIGKREFAATAWHLEATRAMTPEIALFASAGRTLSVLTAGLPARKYVALGLRWAPGGHRADAGAGGTKEMDGRGIRIAREGGAAARLMLRAKAASSVEVMGDFTDWAPVALSATGQGWWTIPNALPPGLYRLNVRYNGGAWEVPPGLPSEADEFNGRVGVLLIVP